MASFNYKFADACCFDISGVSVEARAEFGDGASETESNAILEIVYGIVFIVNVA